MSAPANDHGVAEGWLDGQLPAGVALGTGTVLRGTHSFKRFRATKAGALTIGARCAMDGVHFAIGPEARVIIGDDCCFTSLLLMCEREVRIGHRVLIGWNASIADSDFHPLAPAERIADAIACSPLAAGRPRPAVETRPVTIEDDVWIGPNAAILKGVTVGRGAFVEPGAVVTRDVPPRARIMGNPARVIGQL